MSDPVSLPIAVGLDAGAHTRQALDWAIEEAVRQGCGIRLIHRRSVPVEGPHIEPLMEVSDAMTRQLLKDAKDRIKVVSPAIEVTTATGIGIPARLLVDASAQARLVVVGARGRGSVSSAFLGSTSLDVAAHAHCPVVVVHEKPTGTGPSRGVVVGHDGSELSDTALGEAFRAADARDTTLTVVRTWTVAFADTGMVMIDTDQLRSSLDEQQRTETEQAVSVWSAKFPRVEVRVHVLDSHPVAALVEHSRDAALVVVGSRGLGGFRGMWLGSVSQGVLHQAHCPVMVVRPEPADVAVAGGVDRTAD